MGLKIRDLIVVTDSVMGLLLTTMVATQNVSIETNSIGTIIGKFESVTFNGTDFYLKTFYGIPYAEAPTGDLRFEKPVKKQPFTTPFVAQTLPLLCLQNPAYVRAFNKNISRESQGEDCLSLTILTPPDARDDGSKREVLVWIHGGFYEVGTQNLHLAKMLAATQDIIYVALNYRLSVFGFLSSGDSILPGNNGLWDQRLAIRWIYDNIESFGGNRDRITISGSSAGGASVLYQALYKEEDDQQLFKGVIAQSSSSLFQIAPINKFNEFATVAGCSSGSHSENLSCLKNKHVDSLLEQITFDLTLGPVVDGDFITLNPKEVFLNKNGIADDVLDTFRKYDAMFGLNSDEGALYLFFAGNVYTVDAFANESISFAMNKVEFEDTPFLRSAIQNLYLHELDLDQLEDEIRQSTVELLSDTLFNTFIIQSTTAHAHENASGKTYFYVFDHRSALSVSGIKGANHGEEVPFVHGFPLYQLSFTYGIDVNDPAEVFKQDDLHLSYNLMEYWSNFVKTGNPKEEDNSALTAWPKYELPSQRYIRFKGGYHAYQIESRFAANRMSFWLDLVPVIHRFVNDASSSEDEND